LCVGLTRATQAEAQASKSSRHKNVSQSKKKQTITSAKQLPKGRIKNINIPAPLDRPETNGALVFINHMGIV
jgi:hypothetical protein